MSLEDFRIFLPKYLSSESEAELFNELHEYPQNIRSKSFYTAYLVEYSGILQGDGFNGMTVIHLPDTRTEKLSGIILSNTCDLDLNNKRFLQSRIVYSPIISFQKYVDLISEKSNKSKEQILSHIEAIKKQKITQILYLPSWGRKLEESVVFLDHICNTSLREIPIEEIKTRRLFTLSDYGFYIFLFKLSVHFSRLKEGIERKSLQSFSFK